MLIKIDIKIFKACSLRFAPKVARSTYEEVVRLEIKLVFFSLEKFTISVKIDLRVGHNNVTDYNNNQLIPSVVNTSHMNDFDINSNRVVKISWSK